MAVIDNVKEFIYEYARYVHLNQMPANVRARFEDYKEFKRFAGDMKYWPDIQENIANNDWPQLTDDKLEKLYDLFQAVFENMADHQDDFKLKTETTKPFFEKWFGTGKIFEQSQPVAGVEDRITDFVNRFLNNPTYKTQFAKICSDFRILPDGMDYDEFIDKVTKGDYKTKPDVRKAILRAIEHAQSYSAAGYGPEYWPTGAPEYDVNRAESGLPALDIDTTKWFQHKYNPAFKHRLPELFNKLVSSNAVFEDFKKYDTKGTISSKIEAAVEATAYHKEGASFVPPKDKDVKNVWQRIEDKLDDIKENNIDPWTNILRGNRRFFSPYARTIIEACSKVKNKDGKKLKPTDGLQGILDNKDAIIKKITDKDPKAVAHFKWVTDKLAAYSASAPKAFEGALRNPKQMRKIVSKFIMDGVQEGKIAEAKTALEMISTLKYGIMHSRTVDAMKKEDWTVLSHKDLSWNKYEGVRFVTTAMDKATKFAIIGVGRLAAAIHNKWMRDHTKFNGKDGYLKSAHKLWKARNDISQNEQLQANLNNMITDSNSDYASAQQAIMAEGYRNHRELENDINSKIAEREAKQQQLNNVLGQIKTHNQQHAAMDKERQDAEKAMRDLLGKRNALSGEITTLEQNIADWGTNLLKSIMDDEEQKAIKHKIGEAKLELHEKKKERKDVVQNLRNAAHDFRTKRDDLTTHDNSMPPLTRQQQDLQDEIESLNNSISDKQQMLQDFQDKKQDVLKSKRQLRDARNEHDKWDDTHKDRYLELMAYWDMLESFWKSHQLTLAAGNMRDNFLHGFNQDKDDNPVSKAKILEMRNLERYRQRHAA
ncbi:MAG: hypothetical protein J5608_01065 [Alphaproteobacteria bacterium]|nr:hypothetical protein [Alphaproteobacteria bacterium]